jgi:hypothetical protein
LEDDSLYHVQSEIGDIATISFTVPNLNNELNNTVFLHSKGHYEVLKNPTGKPDIAYLKSFRKPGTFGDYSKKYLQDLENKINCTNH